MASSTSPPTAATTTVTTDNGVILQCFTSEQRYKEAMEQTASFNTRMALERKMRLPFLDSQTGVAQRHTQLFHPYRHRQPGKVSGQLYSYPAKRWKKKKRTFFPSAPAHGQQGDVEPLEDDMHHISTVENPAHRLDDTGYEHHMDASEVWYDELDEFREPPDDGAMVDDQSDISDYEDSLRGKKRKKAPVKGRKKKQQEDNKDLSPEEKEKPYVCEACGARYKTRPGLAYHYSHFHNGLMDEENSTSPKPLTRTNSDVIPKVSKRSRGETSGGGNKVTKAAPPAAATASAVDAAKISANNYCDFCLGDATDNKKTNVPEELVSCSDCGRSGHPTCLQFTDNMIVSVKKYPWQCIECKSCGLCGTSDNDDQLLFCDDCDRGYHMYCLKPPLSEPPEGNWSCHLCIEEFHGGKKPAGMN